MKYLILLDENNCSGCGNDWKATTEYKRYSNILEVARDLLRWNKRAKSVYLVSNYTQKMCEMNASEFGTYVINNGMRLI